MHRSPPGVTNIFQIRKIKRFDKSDKDISDLIIECLVKTKVVKNDILNNFIFYIVLPPGASEVDQTYKFDDFLDLTQYFRFDRTVL